MVHPWCDGCLLQAKAVKKANKQLLDLPSWMLAWDSYALAAAMTEMIPFQVAMRYKQVCLCCVGYPARLRMTLLQVIAELALGAAGEDRTAQFALVYDRLLREEVELRCGQCGDNSRLASMMTTVDLDIERRALRCPVLCRSA